MAAKKTQKKSDYQLPVAEVVPPRLAFEVDDMKVEVRKLNEIADLIWLHGDLEESERNARIARALELYEDLKPSGSAEGMLAAQMVGTHSAAMDCLRRAALYNQTFEGRNMALGHAQKLMALYARQLATLDKHRGKGQQKVTVEHVYVAPGGQAIVGHVETGPRGERDNAPDAIEQAQVVPAPRKKSKSAAPRKKS